MAMPKLIDGDSTSPYGTYAPTLTQKLLLQFAHVMQGSPATLKLALSVKKPLLAVTDAPLHAQAFGCKIRFYPHDNFSERRALTVPDHWDADERKFLTDALPQGGTFVDIGANAGMYAVVMAKAVGPTGTVIAFEPQPRVYERLCFNRDANEFDHMRLMHMGVSDIEGELTLHQPPNNRGEASMSRTFEGGEEINVPVRPLLSVLETEKVPHIDALKIDIEGHEDRAMMPFLTDAPDTLLPRAIVTENSRADWALDWVGAAMARGYSIAMEDRRNLALSRPPTR